MARFYSAPLPQELPMNRLLLLIAFAVSCNAALAGNYPLGTMTCDDIGAFASEAMGWRKSGMTRDQALVRLEERSYNDPVEKKNLLAVLDLVFGSYGRNWSVESAGNIMRTDCKTGRP
jgi:hypothetical protein